MSTLTEKEIEKCVDELKQIRAQEETVLNRLRTKGVTTDEQIAEMTARIVEQRGTRLKEPWPEVFKREMREVVKNLWVSHVSADYSEHGGLLESILEKIGWFEREIDEAECLVLLHVDLSTRERLGGGVGRPAVVACITPYFAVEEEEDGKPSVDWEQFQPCNGEDEVMFTVNTGFQ